MKRNKVLSFIGFAMLFVACSNEADPLVESASAPTMAVLDLQSLNYDELADVLSNAFYSEETVMLKDRLETFSIRLKRNEKAIIEEEGHQTYIFDGIAVGIVDSSLSLGAEHSSIPKDLMAANHDDATSPYHLSADNHDRMLSNLVKK